MAEGIELLRLYQRKSASGRTWFSGRLGGAKVVVLKVENASVEGDTVAVWSVLLRHREPDRENNRNDCQQPLLAKQATVQAPARPKASPASAKPSTAQAKAIADINRRCPTDLNDDIPEL
jgi:hypothetical protein